MAKQQINKSRRALLNTTLGLSALGATLPSSWTKPIVNAVMLPTHAQMSPIDPPPPVDCPSIVVGGVTQSVGASNGLCSLSFEFFSASATPLTITSITNTALTATSEVTFDDVLPTEVTDALGTRVTWTGSLADVDCAAGFSLVAADVTFTVEATCENGAAPVMVDFLLSEIAALL